MGQNSILLCKDSLTQEVDNIHSTGSAVHVVDVSSPYNIGSDMYGSSLRRPVHVHGYSSNVDNVIRDLWEGDTNMYVLPATPMQMRVVSTSANDTAAGTGIQTIDIHYLDDLYTEQTEVVTLNGVTPVATVATNILRVNFFHAITAGTNSVAVGTISLTNAAGTVTYARIQTGLTTARQGVYTVPDGYNMFLASWGGSSGSAIGVHFTRIILAMNQFELTQTDSVFLLQQEVGTLNNGLNVPLGSPVKVLPRTTIKLAAISDAGNADVIALGNVSGYLEQII